MKASTLEEVRSAIESNGLSITEWAASNGFRRENVYAVLAGRTRGRRGEAHRIALALGLKQPAPIPATYWPIKERGIEPSPPRASQAADALP